MGKSRRLVDVIVQIQLIALKTDPQTRIRSFTFAGLLLSSLPASAYLPLNTDDASTVSKGTYQIDQYFYSLLAAGRSSTGFTELISSGEDYQGVDNASAFPLTFTRGFTDSLDVGFSPTYYLEPLGSFSRVSNYTFSLKWRFLGDGQKGLNLALRPGLIAPAGTTQQEFGIGNARWNYGMAFIASQYGENYELHLNAGYLRAPYNSSYAVGLSTDTRRIDLLAVSVAPVWIVSPQWKLALDAGVNTNPSIGDSLLTRYGQVAVLYSPLKDLDIGVSYQRNAGTFGVVLGGTGPYVSRVQFGVSYRFD